MNYFPELLPMMLQFNIITATSTEDSVQGYDKEMASLK